MKTIFITGANRGIGLELCRLYTEAGDQVIAVCRKTSPSLNDLCVRVIDGVDVSNQEDVDRCSDSVADLSIDVLINNAAILRGDSFPHLDPDAIREHFDVNTLGPLRVTLALLDRLHEGSKIAMITSRVGSIQDNGSGGLYGYRISKTALNMLGANLAHDLSKRGIWVGLLHPGYVRTDMTGGQGHMEASEAARGLIQRIAELGPDTTGAFRHANGEPIPW